MNLFTITDAMERGQFPVNIPTSLALESLLNVHPELKHKSPPHLNYDEYWLNARTLYRNITTSFTSDMNVFLRPAVIAELMQDEWNSITTLLQGKTKLNPVLYLCNYQKVQNRYRQHTVFKGDITPKQMDERKRMEESIKLFLKEVGKDYLLMFDTDLIPEAKNLKVIIQTHIAIDLLNEKNFEQLDLLESHTGAIKNRSLWYTKYNNGKELSMIPFTQYFLRIFGDKEFFSPKDGALRKAIVELAQKYNWGPLTTDGRIRQNLDQLQNPFFRAVIKDMM